MDEKENYTSKENNEFANCDFKKNIEQISSMFFSYNFVKSCNTNNIKL